MGNLSFCFRPLLSPKRCSCLAGHPMVSDEVRRRGLGEGSHTLTKIIDLSRPWWLEHMLCMAAHCLPFRVLFAPVGQGLEKQCRGQAMT